MFINGAFEDVKRYLKVHWIAILIGAIPTICFFTIGIITFIINIYIAWQQVKITAEANTQQLQVVSIQNQKLLQNDTGIRQQLMDQSQQITDLKIDLQDIHRWFFGNNSGH